MKTAKILLYFMVIIFEEMKHFVRASRLLEQKKKKEWKANMKFYTHLAWAGKEMQIIYTDLPIPI